MDIITNTTFQVLTAVNPLLDSIALARFVKLREQIVSPTSSSRGLMCTSIKTFDLVPKKVKITNPLTHVSNQTSKDF